MTGWCPNCGRRVDEGERFCRQCGMPQHLSGEEATEWVLSHSGARTSETGRPTAQSAAPTTPAYVPPAYLTPTAPPQAPPAERSYISLGEWLSRGWQVYKENWFTMSLATLIGAFLGLVTIGILAGPLLMGLYRMAFKTMRGERPEINDLFNWEGRFLQPFLAFLIFALIHFGISGMDRTGTFAAIFNFVASPFLTVMLALTMPLLLEQKMDVGNAINRVWKLIFKRDTFMWWIVGLVFSAISLGGAIVCGIGIFITVPWIISSGAIAYSDVFGIDDPNRTNA